MLLLLLILVVVWVVLLLPLLLPLLVLRSERAESRGEQPPQKRDSYIPPRLMIAGAIFIRPAACSPSSLLY